MGNYPNTQRERASGIIIWRYNSLRVWHLQEMCYSLHHRNWPNKCIVVILWKGNCIFCIYRNRVDILTNNPKSKKKMEEKKG